MSRKVLVYVALIGFVSLCFELVQVRLLTFLLGSVSNFLAIPIALLGLSLGSMIAHYAPRQHRIRWVEMLSWTVLPVIALCLAAVYAISNRWFPEIHATLQSPAETAVKLLAFSVLFMAPYIVLGSLLSCYFEDAPKEIGKLYFFDLLGASLGCLVVPLLLTTASLQIVLAVLFASASLVSVRALDVSRAHWQAVPPVAAFLAILFIGQWTGYLFHDRPDPAVIAKTLLRNRPGKIYEEAAVRWNEIARTSLVLERESTSHGKGRIQNAVVVQDDGISNVRVRPYDSAIPAQRWIDRGYYQAIPYALGRFPEKVLVMFAGAGNDMIIIDSLSAGSASITGVELNGAVLELAKQARPKQFRLSSFFAKPNIRFVVAEGRDFLNRDTAKYDYIYVASNGAVEVSRTGSTRKYLDTIEAMEAYLERLTPDGIMVFSFQHNEPKMVVLEQLLAKRGLGPAKNHVILIGNGPDPHLDTMAFSLVPFTDEQSQTVLLLAQKNIKRASLLLGPQLGRATRATRLLDEPSEKKVGIGMTDDRPFFSRIDFAAFELFPPRSKLGDLTYAQQWIRIFTVLLFGVLSIIIGAVAIGLGTRAQRVPISVGAYLLGTGVAYMGVEVGLMAKLELFLGNPLYSIAAVLALFLASNSLGALIQGRLRDKVGPLAAVFGTVAAIAWAMWWSHICISTFLSLSIWLKILMVAVGVFPVGFCLGMYFPIGVDTLVRMGKERAITAAYAISTLSSVLGSAVAMTIVPNVGFTRCILAGAILYAVAGMMLWLVMKKSQRIA